MRTTKPFKMMIGGTGAVYVGTSVNREAPKITTPDEMRSMIKGISKIESEDFDLAKLIAGGPSVDVVIPHYGDNEDLDLCLGTLEYDPCVDGVLILDNNKENLGFTKAVNNGIRHFWDSGNDYIAVVNNDTEILEGGFAPLVARMILSPKCGIVAPMSVLHDNPDQIQHAGGDQAFPNGIHFSGIRSLGQCSDPAKRKWLSFVVVLIRKSAILETGLLDEKMFLIASDSDYCFRLRYAGWECWYEPKSVWTHKCGESSAATSPESESIQRTDMYAFYRKWVKQGGLYTELVNEVL